MRSDSKYWIKIFRYEGFIVAYNIKYNNFFLFNRKKKKKDSTNRFKPHVSYRKIDIISREKVVYMVYYYLKSPKIRYYDIFKKK